MLSVLSVVHSISNPRIPPIPPMFLSFSSIRATEGSAGAPSVACLGASQPSWLKPFGFTTPIGLLYSGAERDSSDGGLDDVPVILNHDGFDSNLITIDPRVMLVHGFSYMCV